MLTRSYQPAEDDAPLSRGFAIVLALACIGLGVWASYITLRFFEHGAAALEGDEAIRALAMAAALMFVVTEMAAFGLAALLPRRRLRAARWKLVGFAVAVLALEVATIILVQHAITKGADMTASAGTSRAADLRASIDSKRATIAELRSRGLLRRAEALQKDVDAQAAELATVQAGRKPTTTELLGETGALVYAVARGLLVSIAGLVFFGAAGALLRMSRGARAAAAAAPGAAPVPVPAGIEDDAPAGRSLAAALPDSAKVVPIKRGDGRWALAAGAGLAAFAAAAPTPSQATPMAHQATMPRVNPGSLGAASESERAHPGGLEQTHPGGFERAQQAQAAAAPEQAQQAKKQRTQRRAQVVDGSRRDTGTGTADGHRYQRVRAAIESGAMRPGRNAIMAAENCGATVANRYLAQLVGEGVIERTQGGAYRLAERLAA